MKSTSTMMLMGVLACLGLAAGASAACPPEGEGAELVLTPHLQVAGEGGNGHFLTLAPRLRVVGDEDRGRVVTLALQPHINTDGTARIKVLGRADARPDDGSQHFVLVKDKDSVSVKIKDGKIVEIEHNGKKVPLDQVKRDGNHVKILGKDGGTVFEFDMADDGSSAGGDVDFGPGDQQALGFATNMEPPKAMIGVQLGEPGSMLLGHFGLKAGEATLVTGVYETLPAGKAGLEPYDIIVAVNGKTPAGQADVRDALRTKDAGDSVTLTVIHHGDRHDVKVTLTKYDEDALSNAKLDAIEAAPMLGSGGGDPFSVYLAPRLGQLRGLQGQDPAAMKEWAERWSKEMEKFGQDAARAGARGIPAPPEPPDAGGAESRWQRVEERLDRLEKMIERLAEHRAGQGGGQ